ncbi:MAG: choice-of-anchor L domain-containing protein [Cyanobacteria bacterium J06636_16]
MRFTTQVALTAGLAVGASLNVITRPAVAFTITQNNDFDSFLSVLLGDTTGLSGFTGTVDGSPEAFGTFADDPFGLGSGVVLSTGNVADLPGENTGDLFTDSDLTTDLPSPVDEAILEINFEADETVDQLFFQYVFGSEEFLEFGGSIFNDFFTLELNGTNLALLNDTVGDDNFVRVNNLVQSPTGPRSTDYIDNPSGPGTLTKLDGYTRPLQSGSVGYCYRLLHHQQIAVVGCNHLTL